MTNCIKDNFQIECDQKLEKLTKKSIYEGQKLLNKNIKSKKDSDNLILIEWDMDYDDTCSCLNEIIRHFTNKYKKYHCLPILYRSTINGKKYYFVHEIVELNELLDDYYHIALELIDNNRYKLRNISKYEDFKTEICRKYKNIIICTPKYYKVPKLEFIRDIMRRDFEQICNIR